MIKKLQRQFAMWSILTITFVITIIFIFINYLNYLGIGDRSKDIMNILRTEETAFNRILVSNLGIITSEKYFYNSFIIAPIKRSNIDKNDKIIKVIERNASIDIEKSRELVNNIIKTHKKTGYIGNYSFGYIEKNDFKYLILVDLEKEWTLFYQFLKNSMIVALSIILITSLLLVKISKKVVKPIEENYQKQRQFITDASHELKTPLTIINSNADVLEMVIGKSKWLDNIHTQIDRLTNLINSLVAFSRVDEKDSLEKIKFSLSDLLNSRVQEFDELAYFKGKKIKTNIEDNIIYFGENNSITQVIDILIDNAIKYARKDTDILIDLKLEKKDLILKIENEADGIKKGELNNVFDRFYRLDESRNSKIKGYGIGLSLAKLIIDKHKSKISAYSPKDDVFVILIHFNK